MVKELVKKHLAFFYNYEKIASDCIYKMEAGEEKYGSVLQTNNGRDADLDAYQDLLDTINYSVQGYYEEDDSFVAAERDLDIDHLCYVAGKIRKRLIAKGIITEE